MPAKPYDITDWYWVVADDTNQVYSSKAVGYVPLSDPAYQMFLTSGALPTRIINQQELADLLILSDVPVPGGVNSSDVAKESLFGKIPPILKKWALDIDNRVRVLEGQPTRNANQFKNYVKSLM